jgi:hypothetical protein
MMNHATHKIEVNNIDKRPWNKLNFLCLNSTSVACDVMEIPQFISRRSSCGSVTFMYGVKEIP